MNGYCSSLPPGIRGRLARLLALPMALAMVALAACNGTAVVTMTSTASQDNFLAYRVGLVSVELESSSGKSGLKILPASTTVDFAGLTWVSEVLGAVAVAKGSYKSALITLDYSAAQIIFDDGSLNGVQLTPVGANGQALGQVQLTVNLDPSESFDVSSKGASQLALDFNLAASNTVNLSAKTVTVTPLIAASAMPIDSKPVRIRGPIVGAASGSVSSTASTSFTMGVLHFIGCARGSGNLAVVPSDTTTFEINGIESTGAAGLGQLASVGAGALTVAYGTLTTTDQTSTTTTPTTTTPTDTVRRRTTTPTGPRRSPPPRSPPAPSLTPRRRYSQAAACRAGVRIASRESCRRAAATPSPSRTGRWLAMTAPKPFWAAPPSSSWAPIPWSRSSGRAPSKFNSPQQVTVGSAIDAFGVASSQSLGNATLDASAGRVRLDPVAASGLVTAQGSGTLNLNLASLGGRSIAPFDFIGSGIDPRQYVVTAGTLDLSNSTAGAPVIVTGLPNSFGAAPPNFTASALLDPTTIAAELVVDWGAGTAAPFTTYDSSAIDVDVHNAAIGTRHQIEVGAEVINIVGLTSDPQIVPNPTSPNTVYSIGHSKSSTIENFNTYDAFVTQLQTELKGSTLATGLTAVGQYTASSFSFAATSITLSLNN